jgi:predicted metal-dependent peptidase
MGITIAAVNMQSREIYMNPSAGLDEEETRFVMAHELLHVGLRHDVRCQGRDPFLWNIAADFVINEWLVEMGVGTMPRGVLFDPELKGLSAEAIYDRIVTDIRRYRKLATMRGIGLSDILEPSIPEWWSHGDGCDLDGFYRRALSQGLLYHDQAGRGLLPAGLIEEIRALDQPPIPWDVRLAEWFDAHFPPLEKERTYARPSRRQSSTPDIPRPYWTFRPEDLEQRTFGVVLDTSGSMDRVLLAKALGAIASYSLARDVPGVRVVFCDAAPYDQGYMPPEDIAGRVKVRGRGGTILQPGIDLLERARDFPKDGPILVITDGYCDKLTVRRDHAFIVPEGHHLPFVPRGEVFRIR